MTKIILLMAMSLFNLVLMLVALLTTWTPSPQLVAVAAFAGSTIAYLALTSIQIAEFKAKQ